MDFLFIFESFIADDCCLLFGDGERSFLFVDTFPLVLVSFDAAAAVGSTSTGRKYGYTYRRNAWLNEQCNAEESK